MKSLIEYLKEEEQQLNEEMQELLEKLITFDGKAYPKFNNVVILAGGAGSGKGFVRSNLLGIDGFVYDVDHLKSLVIWSEKIAAGIKREFGLDLSKFRDKKRFEVILKDDTVVEKLHYIIADNLGLDDKKTETFYRSVLKADPRRKPNIIFDVTLKDLRKLDKLAKAVENLGYEKQNVHIVWVVQDIEVAVELNQKRPRVVPQHILVSTHRGASNTMMDIIKMGKSLDRYMDGDIVFAFNKIKVDSEVEKSGRGGQYVKDANYFYIKRAGKQVMSIDEIGKDIRQKIKDYVPKNVEWA